MGVLELLELYGRVSPPESAYPIIPDRARVRAYAQSGTCLIVCMAALVAASLRHAITTLYPAL